MGMKEIITLYHGSQRIIKIPAFGAGNPQNDYGLGFYCTLEIELAKEWACTHESGGFANQYELDLSGLSVVRLSGADYNILNWLAILLDNRNFRVSSDIAAEGKKYLLDNFLPDVHNTDVIIGYRANDSYFAFASAFLNNTIALSQLETAMYLGKLGEQTMLKSKAAFERVTFIRSEAVEREIYYPKRRDRDETARASYREQRNARRVADSVFMIDILRERWQNDDARIRRNLPG
jgi:hypothetical protein